MAQQRLAPDAILVQTGLTGAVTSIVDDPDSPDGLWLTASVGNNTDIRVSFPTPIGPLTPGAGLQAFRALVRKNASRDATVSLELWEAGVLVATVASGVLVSSSTGQVVEAVWSETGRTPSAIECRVVGTAASSGPGSERSAVEVGAIEWNAQLKNRGSASGGFTFTGSASGRRPSRAQGLFAYAGSAAGHRPPNQNLVNGSFEDGLIGWTPDPTAALIHETTTVHSGSGAASLAGKMKSEAFVVKPEVEELDVRFQYRDAQIACNVEWYDAAGVFLGDAASFIFAKSTSWNSIRRFYTPLANTAAAKLTVRTTTVDVALFDTFVVVHVGGELPVPVFAAFGIPL